ncbi:MAG: hypothetical protein F6K00_32440 [Leptolyngbya sp. SIOISBB]|nr:hypothetical protein [Leptolyngbya sp. SIOISBB]
MHTWALFSCSSLITLTAYNLTHLPKTPKPAPEPEPDPSDQMAADAKFSLDVMAGQFPEFERIAQPALPDQPQLSKVDELPGYNPAVYDPLQSPVREVNLVGALSQAKLEGGITYRVDAVAPLPTLLPPPPPSVNPFPVANPLPTAIATAPPTATQPRPERAAAAPSFAPRATPAPIAQVPTNPTPSATPLPSAEPSTDTVSVADTPELFAALPEHAVPIAPTPQPEPIELTAPQPAPADLAMTDVVAVDPLAQITDSSVTVTPEAVPVSLEVSPIATEPAPVPFEVSPVAPEPAASMDLAMPRHDLIEGYCDRPLADTNEATRLAVCDGGTSE